MKIYGSLSCDVCFPSYSVFSRDRRLTGRRGSRRAGAARERGNRRTGVRRVADRSRINGPEDEEETRDTGVSEMSFRRRYLIVRAAVKREPEGAKPTVKTVYIKMEKVQ